jgi:hypothetical protein
LAAHKVTAKADHEFQAPRLGICITELLDEQRRTSGRTSRGSPWLAILLCARGEYLYEWDCCEPAEAFVEQTPKLEQNGKALHSEAITIPNAAAIPEHLEKILASRTFRAADGQRNFL